VVYEINSTVSQQEPSATLGGAVLRGHEQRPLLNSSAVIFQNPIDEQRATCVESLWNGATNHERLRTTALDLSSKVIDLISKAVVYLEDQFFNTLRCLIITFMNSQRPLSTHSSLPNVSLNQVLAFVYKFITYCKRISTYFAD